ncbi:MAG: hypothetical protein WCO91_11100 [Gemmataceae bacterium]
MAISWIGKSVLGFKVDYLGFKVDYLGFKVNYKGGGELFSSPPCLNE